MKWIKLGHIYTASGESEWMHSHAAVPFVEYLTDDVFRVYFTTRSKDNKSYTTYLDLDITNPQSIINISEVPVLSPGELGHFDDSGAMGSWLVKHNNEKYMHYIGWNLGVTVPFRNSIGLAVSNEIGIFEKAYGGPILDRTKEEPLFCSNSCVLIEDNVWKMWYLSCVAWFNKRDKVEHKYHIKYATSEDGVNWNRNGTVAIDFKNEGEYAISRPCVIKDEDCYRMWFSYRGESYRIGYAESKDGISWCRKDENVGITVSENGWDSEMIEYPFVFDHKGNRYMLYNGNGYGKTGFGLAVLENNE